jgi:hypothetical protein
MHTHPMTEKLSTAWRKARQVRRGRAAVLWALGAFLALQAAFHYPLTRLWPQLRDAEYGNKIAALRNKRSGPGRNHPLIVALGSSMTAMALCPDALATCQPNDPDGPLVYNFAMNSSGNVVQLLCLRRLLDEGIRPDLVLVEASPHFLYRKHNTYQQGEFFPHLRLEAGDFAVLNRYADQPRRLWRRWCKAQTWPWLAHRHNIQNWLIPSWVGRELLVHHLWIHTDEWGWETMPNPQQIHDRYFKSPNRRAAIHNYLRYLGRQPFDRDMERALAEVIETCQSRQIAVVLVRPPEHRWVREGYAQGADPRMAALFRELTARTGVPLVDGKDWVPDTGFINGMHVSADGARTFTRRFEREVLRPMLQTGQQSPDADRLSRK